MLVHQTPVTRHQTNIVNRVHEQTNRLRERISIPTCKLLPEGTNILWLLPPFFSVSYSQFLFRGIDCPFGTPPLERTGGPTITNDDGNAVIRGFPPSIVILLLFLLHDMTHHRAYRPLSSAPFSSTTHQPIAPRTNPPFFLLNPDKSIHREVRIYIRTISGFIIKVISRRTGYTELRDKREKREPRNWKIGKDRSHLIHH